MTEPVAESFGLYRWYDAADIAIYYGISRSMSARQSAHAKRASWGVFAHRATVERFDTWETALEAERAAIQADRPIFNQTHNDSLDARIRLQDYLTRNGRLDLLKGEPLVDPRVIAQQAAIAERAKELDAITAELAPLEQERRPLLEEATEIVIRLLKAGEPPTKVARRSPFSDAHVRVLARRAGIPPAKPGIKRPRS